ncbi:MAG: rhodanese-like domain-containing protein [Rhodospirillales bacterium]
MSYAGDLNPKEAWEMLSEEENAVLIDVRTMPEWAFVGMPDISALGKQPVRLSWQAFPTMDIDEDFTAKLAGAAPDKNQPLLFICRSGARSAHAAMAMTADGYTRCYNVAGGFEGDPDMNRHRGQVNGWKAAGLPWAQS